MRWRAPGGNWLLIGIVVALVAVMAVVVMRRDRKQSDPEADPTPVASASISPSAAPVCLPVVKESGFSAEEHTINFALIVANPCAQAVVNTNIRVDAVDANGDQLFVSEETVARLPVLLPGKEAGLGGDISVKGDATKARKLSLTPGNTQNIPAAGFAGWPLDATVTDVKHTARDEHGAVSVTGTVVTDPPGRELCRPTYYLVLRDKKGAIVYGDENVRSPLEFTIDPPASVDWSSAEIWIGQGRFSFGNLGTGPGVAC